MRNYRYPNLGDNPRNLCETCGSIRLNGTCMRSCNENGPTISLDGRRMKPEWVAMSNELGTTKWFGSDQDMYTAIEYWTTYFQAQAERVVALNHMRETMRRYNISA